MKATGIVQFYDALYIFRCQRLKIKFVSNIKVGRNCLRVIVNDNKRRNRCESEWKDQLSQGCRHGSGGIS